MVPLRHPMVKPYPLELRHLMAFFAALLRDMTKTMAYEAFSICKGIAPGAAVQIHSSPAAYLAAAAAAAAVLALAFVLPTLPPWAELSWLVLELLGAAAVVCLSVVVCFLLGAHLLCIDV